MSIQRKPTPVLTASGELGLTIQNQATSNKGNRYFILEVCSKEGDLSRGVFFVRRVKLIDFNAFRDAMIEQTDAIIGFENKKGWDRTAQRLLNEWTAFKDSLSRTDCVTCSLLGHYVPCVWCPTCRRYVETNPLGGWNALSKACMYDRIVAWRTSCNHEVFHIDEIVPETPYFNNIREVIDRQERGKLEISPSPAEIRHSLQVIGIAAPVKEGGRP